MTDEKTTDYPAIETLFDVEDLPLVARSVVDGFLSGYHRSPYFGHSSEFASYRPYMKGDDLRRVDWKVWARTDELYVKQFEDETNLYGHILLDCSASMDFGSPNKFRFARTLASAMSYLMVRQHDAPGLVLFGRDRCDLLSPRSHQTHLDEVLKLLSRASPDGRAGLDSDIWEVVETIHRRGITVVISDLLSDVEKVEKLLKQLYFQRQEVLLFQVLAPEERDFNYKGEYLIEDSETGETVTVHADMFRKIYQQRLREFCERVAHGANGLGADYNRAYSDAALGDALGEYLERRSLIA